MKTDEALTALRAARRDLDDVIADIEDVRSGEELADDLLRLVWLIEQGSVFAPQTPADFREALLHVLEHSATVTA